jgi:hypothetical protein
VPVAFFFEGAPKASAPHGSHGSALSIAQIDNFVSDSNGLRAPRKIGPARRTPQNCPRMIPFRSPFRFINVHSEAVSDRQRKRFFEVPLRLIGAFMRIDNAELRRRIVMLVQEIPGDDGD